MRYSDIKVGYDCNNHCIHCIIANQRMNAMEKRGDENRSTDECCAEIRDSAENGYDSIIITGGEPTIRDDFLEILQYAKGLGLGISVQTNGRRLADPDFAANAAKYVDNFIVALHGSNPACHDHITRAKNSFAETVEGLKNIALLEKTLVIKVVMTKFNEQDLPDILRLVNGLGIQTVNIAFPHACEEMVKHYEQVVPMYADVRASVDECIRYAQESGMSLEFESVLPCALTTRHDVRFFSDFQYMDVESEVKQLDNATLQWNRARKRLKRKMEKCSLCTYNSLCEGYWMEYVILRGESEFVPINA